MVVLGGVAVSHERGIPLLALDCDQALLALASCHTFGSGGCGRRQEGGGGGGNGGGDGSAVAVVREEDAPRQPQEDPREVQEVQGVVEDEDAWLRIWGLYMYIYTIYIYIYIYKYIYI